METLVYCQYTVAFNVFGISACQGTQNTVAVLKLSYATFLSFSSICQVLNTLSKQ